MFHCLREEGERTSPTHVEVLRWRQTAVVELGGPAGGEDSNGR